MGPWKMKAFLGSYFALPCLALVTASATIFVVRHLKKRSNARLPPIAASKAWDVVRQLTGTSVPVFQFQMGLALGIPVYRLPLPFGQTLFVVMDAATANTILKDDDKKPSLFTDITEKIFSGPNIVSIPTTSLQWQKLRKALAHMFSPNVLSQQVPLLHDHVDHLVGILDECCEIQKEVDIVPLLLRFALDFVGLFAFEYDLQSLKDPLHSDGALFLRELDLAFEEFAVNQLVNPLRRFMFWNAGVRRANLSAKRLYSLSLKIMNHYQQRHSAEEIQSSQSLMAEILRNPYYPNDAARAFEVTGFLMGGHDTTSNSLAWILYDLACHPEVAAEVYAELDNAMAVDSRLNVSQLNQLKMLDACIKESMRLWPVFGLGFFRQTSKVTHYKDMIIPAGSVVVTPFYGIGRWPDNIEEPEEYRPHRWLGTQEEVDALEERFVMFGKGRRNCMGQNLARMEMRLVLARLLHRFRFEVAQEPTYCHCGTSKPLNLKLRVHHRA